MSELKPAIFKHWVHSHEEDTTDIKVYRPHDHRFPRSRGRRGFEIKENGEFIRYDIAPDDRIKRVQGHFKVEGRNRFHIFFEDPKFKSYTMNIVSLSENVLKLRRHRT